MRKPVSMPMDASGIQASFRATMAECGIKKSCQYVLCGMPMPPTYAHITKVIQDHTAKRIEEVSDGFVLSWEDQS